jgi:competence protein ComEC
VTPLIAGNFNRITVSSLVLNFAAIPLVGLIMGLGYAFLPFAAAFPAAAGPPAAVLGFLVKAFAAVSHALDPFPFLSFRVPTPPDGVVCGYVLFLGLAFVRPRSPAQRRLALAGFCFFLFLLAASPFRDAPPGLRVTMLDVGQGDSILVEFPCGRTMLVDGGGLAGSSFDVGERVVSPVLWRKGIKRVDYMVLTHPHPDHLGGLVAVARNFRIGEFWEGDHGPAAGARAALDGALARTVIRRRCGRGSVLRVGEATVTVLHPAGPAGAPRADVNESSLVIKVAWGRTAFLLMGDAGTAAERELLGAGLDLRSGVLKAGHHGSSGAGSQDFLSAVRPAVVLVSAGENNVYGFPGAEFLARCRAAGAEVLRTDVHGAVEVLADGRDFRVRTALPGPVGDGCRLPFDTYD